MYVNIPGKLSEIHLHAWLFSNPCGKVLIIIAISWSPDLRVQHKLLYVWGAKAQCGMLACIFIGLPIAKYRYIIFPWNPGGLQEEVQQNQFYNTLVYNALVFQSR